MVATKTPPFAKGDQLCHDLDLDPENAEILAALPPAAAENPRADIVHQEAEAAGLPAVHQAAPAPAQATATLPGDPRLGLLDSDIGEKLDAEFMTPVLNKLAPRLWLMTTQSSENIEPLTEQLVRGRKVVISEKPGLHLVWINNRVFLKPLPKYLLSHAFWEYYLVKPNPHIPSDLQMKLHQAARGFLRSYACLIKHESDFVLATQEKTRLIPKGIEFADFVKFILLCKANIGDDDVSPRYHFGELRLTRLNFWCRIFLLKATYQKVEWQYAAYFAHYYAPILFVFALFSLLISAMQLVLAVRTILEPNDAWLVFARVGRGFALFTIFVVASVIGALLLIFAVFVLRETIYALEDLATKRTKGDQENQAGNYESPAVDAKSVG
jgi:hypothetical protein